MKLRIILFSILVCFIAGCSKKSNLITIFPLKPDNKVFSAKVVKSIPLSNPVEAAIGSIDKLVVYKDRIYVFEANQVNGLLILTETGTFLKKISYGRGPGELSTRN